MTSLLPDAAIEELRQMLETSDGLQFAIGDYIVELVDEMAPGIARAHVIRQLSTGTGCDTSTLRDRETMARFWTPALRNQFDPLTYHQLRACGRSGEYSLTVAEWALANLPAPVASIWAYRKGRGHMEPAWIGRWERLLVSCDTIAEDTAADVEVRRLCHAFLDRAEKLGSRTQTQALAG